MAKLARELKKESETEASACSAVCQKNNALSAMSTHAPPTHALRRWPTRDAFQIIPHIPVVPGLTTVAPSGVWILYGTGARASR